MSLGFSSLAKMRANSSSSSSAAISSSPSAPIMVTSASRVLSMVRGSSLGGALSPSSSCSRRRASCPALRSSFFSLRNLAITCCRFILFLMCDGLRSGSRSPPSRSAASAAAAAPAATAPAPAPSSPVVFLRFAGILPMVAEMLKWLAIDVLTPPPTKHPRWCSDTV